MSDQAALSKAAKKNKKRKDKKKQQHGGEGSESSRQSDPGPQQMLDALKEELITAKNNQDHAKAKKLREQIWVLNDLVNGIRTEIPDEELAPILESIPLFQKKKLTAATEEPVAVTLSAPDKKIRSLQKKLDQIDRLKEMQAKGEKMQENQLKKMASEQEIRDEIKELEEVMAQLGMKN